MKKIIFLLVFYYSLFISHYSFSQSGWVQLNAGTNRYFGDVYFINENTGWCVSDSARILKTTNSGFNWTSSIIYNNPKLFFSFIRFADNLTGYAGGGINDVLAYLKYRLLFKTTNQGQDWFLIRYVPDFEMQYYTSISIISPDSFFVSARGQYSLGGTFGFIEKTVNGGINYVVSGGPGYNSIWFINSLMGWAAAFYADDIGQKKDYIFNTTNGGLNWNTQYKDTITSISINKIQFINQNTGFGVGGSYSMSGNSKFFKTTNGGSNWSVILTPYLKTFLSLFFVNESTGWICGNWSSADSTTIARTTNGGLTFQKQRKTAINDGISSIYFINSLTGFATGGAKIFKTTNGGVTSVEIINTEIPDNFSLSQNYPNPFNPTTNIKFKVASYKVIKLIVYDILGKEVATLVNEKITPGEYETQFPNEQMNNVQLPSGVYFYSLFADGKLIDTKKLVLLK